MEDRTGILIQENDVVLIIINNKSNLVVVRGGATRQGMLRGINISFDNSKSLKNIIFKPHHAIIVSKEQVLSLINKQIENLNTKLDIQMDNNAFCEGTKEFLRDNFNERIRLIEIIQQALLHPLETRECMRRLEFVAKKYK